MNEWISLYTFRHVHSEILIYRIAAVYLHKYAHIYIYIYIYMYNMYICNAITRRPHERILQRRGVVSLGGRTQKYSANSSFTSGLGPINTHLPINLSTHTYLHACHHLRHPCIDTRLPTHVPSPWTYIHRHAASNARAMTRVATHFAQQYTCHRPSLRLLPLSLSSSLLLPLSPALPLSLFFFLPFSVPPSRPRALLPSHPLALSPCPWSLSFSHLPLPFPLVHVPRHIFFLSLPPPPLLSPALSIKHLHRHSRVFVVHCVAGSSLALCLTCGVCVWHVSCVWHVVCVWHVSCVWHVVCVTWLIRHVWQREMCMLPYLYIWERERETCMIPHLWHHIYTVSDIYDTTSIHLMYHHLYTSHVWQVWYHIYMCYHVYILKRDHTCHETCMIPHLYVLWGGFG